MGCQIWYKLAQTVRIYKQIPWLLVGKRTIQIERPLLVGKILVPTFADREVSRGERGGSPQPLLSVLYIEAAIFSFK
jgi:hypothetical protein